MPLTPVYPARQTVSGGPDSKLAAVCTTVFPLDAIYYIRICGYTQVECPGIMKTPIEPIKIFKTLSDETRLRILWILENHELNVNEIVEILGSTQSRVSRHLTVLKENGFLDSRREGTWVYYRKPEKPSMGPEVREAWRLVKDWSGGRGDRAEDRTRLEEVLRRKRERSMRFYGEHASRWDHIRDTLCGDLVTLQAFLSLIPPSITVADVGTGTGQLLIPLARMVERVIGVDHSPEMIRLARRNAEAGELDNVDLRLGEIDELPLAEAEADAVFASLVLHHAPDPGKAVAEMARVVKPGGAVTIIDLQSHNEEWMRDELAHIWLGFEEADLRRWFKNAGLIRGQWIEGIPHHSGNHKGKPPVRVKSFVFHGRKK